MTSGSRRPERFAMGVGKFPSSSTRLISSHHARAALRWEIEYKSRLITNSRFRSMRSDRGQEMPTNSASGFACPEGPDEIEPAGPQRARPDEARLPATLVPSVKHLAKFASNAL